jgi:hypothetical protein
MDAGIEARQWGGATFAWFPCSAKKQSHRERMELDAVKIFPPVSTLKATTPALRDRDLTKKSALRR